MGRFLKKVETVGGPNALALQIPTSTTAAGPEQIDDGMIRWNTSTQRVEFWYETQWLTVAKVGSVQITTDEFTGDNATTTFTMRKLSQTQMQLLYKLGEYINNQMLITL